MRRILLIGICFLTVQMVMPQRNLDSQKTDSHFYHNLRSGLDHSGNVFMENGKGTVAFLGGSITYNPGWRDSICHYLINRFPETDFEFIATGIPSMGSTPDAFRLERDVLSKGKVDLLFIDYAVNDRGNGRTSKERIRATEGIVRHALRTNPSMDIVFLYFVDPGKMEDYRCGNVPAEIQDYEKVAKHYGIPTVNLAKEVSMRIDAGEFTWEGDFKDLHPSPFGQGVYYRSIKTLLENAYKAPAELSDINTEQILPGKLDEFCYDMGTLVPINESKPGKGWEIIANWKPEDRAGTRAGYVNVPMLLAESPGSELLLKFEGRAVGIAVAAGPDAGIIEYRIDKLPWEKLDIFTKWSEHLHLPWYYVLNAELPDGKHRLRIRISEKKNESSKGNACRIAHFFVNK